MRQARFWTVLEGMSVIGRFRTPTEVDLNVVASSQGGRRDTGMASFISTKWQLFLQIV